MTTFGGCFFWFFLRVLSWDVQIMKSIILPPEINPWFPPLLEMTFFWIYKFNYFSFNSLLFPHSKKHTIKCLFFYLSIHLFINLFNKRLYIISYFANLSLNSKGTEMKQRCSFVCLLGVKEVSNRFGFIPFVCSIFSSEVDKFRGLCK